MQDPNLKRYLRSPVCPACGSAELICHGKRNMFYPSGCLAILGLAFGPWHQASSPLEYECTACHKRFAKRTLGALVVFWMLPLLVLILFAVRYAPLWLR